MVAGLTSCQNWLNWLTFLDKWLVAHFTTCRTATILNVNLPRRSQLTLFCYNFILISKPLENSFMWQLKIKSYIPQKKSKLVLRPQDTLNGTRVLCLLYKRNNFKHWILQLVAGRRIIMVSPTTTTVYNTFWLLLWQQRYIAGCKFPTLNSTVHRHFQQWDRLCELSPRISCFLHEIAMQIIASLVCLLNNFDGLKNFR